MPILLAAIAAVAVLSVVASLGSGGGDFKKKLSDAVNPGGIKGAGGSVFFPGLGPPQGVGSGGSFTDTTTTAPGPAVGAPSAPAVGAPLASQSSGMAAVFDRLEPAPSPAPPPNNGVSLNPQNTWDPSAGGKIVPLLPNSAVAPNVVQLAPLTVSAQPLPPTYEPPEPRDTPPGPAPSPQTISPAQLYPADFGLSGPPLGATPQTSSLAGTSSPYIQAPPPAYVPVGGGGALDPGAYSSQYAYSAPNAGVSVAAPPGAGGGNTYS